MRCVQPKDWTKQRSYWKNFSNTRKPSSTATTRFGSNEFERQIASYDHQWAAVVHVKQKSIAHIVLPGEKMAQTFTFNLPRIVGRRKQLTGNSNFDRLSYTSAKTCENIYEDLPSETWKLKTRNFVTLHLSLPYRKSAIA